MKKNRKKNSDLSTSYKAKIILKILGVGMLCVCIVVISAYRADLNFKLLNTQNEISDLETQNNSIESEINSRLSLTNLEQKALDLGMIYPSDQEENLIYLTNTPDKKDFAKKIKELGMNRK